LREKRVTN